MASEADKPSASAAETIFIAALAMPMTERAAYLAGACGDDPRLRRRVEALLKAHEAPEGFLPEQSAAPTSAASKLAPFLAASLTEQPGDCIGRYKLLQKIGEGGCGVVYMAQQEQPVRRKVALKIIKLGMDTRQVVARFEAERQALALMDHANIAKVLDAGATETGRPYFVMELVGGIKITDYCEQNHLSTRRRLELFIQVCRAVQHAHQKGVIHRDLKPSNVLVAEQDGVAVPKVIDFGIVKATQGRLIDETIFTAFEQFLGTPAYMSPEQAQLGGLDVDTRSDIYSLGVLLYELLTGKTPFDSKELLAAGLDVMRRTIQEKEPPAPSTRLRQETAVRAVNSGKSEIGNCRSEIDRDLDWIVMRCLEKDRARRYETANGVAMDIERHLGNEPVVARPPSRIYSLQKLYRRNRLLCVASVLTLFVAILGAGGVFWQWQQARRHAERERNERQRAEAATRQAFATLTRMEAIEIRRAEEYYEAGDRRNMLPYLALVLRQNPTSRLAAERLFSTLSHRNWARLACPPMEHSNRLTFASLSRDGKRVVTSGSDGAAWVWDAATGRRLAGPLAHRAEINTVTFSPDGGLVVTASQDKTARVWNAATGLPVTEPLLHEGDVRTADFSPDGNLVFTSSGRTGHLWNVATGRRVGTVLYASGEILDARFNADGARLALACRGGQAQIWDVSSGTCLHRMEHAGDVYSIAFSPDATCLVTACADATARVWDAKSGQPMTGPLAHQGPVQGAEFSPDGQRIVTASSDHTAQVWEARTGQKIGPPLKHGDVVRSASFSPEGLRVVTSSWDNTARVWDALSGAPLTEPMAHEREVFYAQFTPDGQRLLTACNGNAANIWDIIGSSTLSFQIGAPTGSLEFSPDGGCLVIGSDGAHTGVWEALTGRPAVRFVPHGPGPEATWINQAVFSPDGIRVATADDDGFVRIWDAADGRLLAGPVSDHCREKMLRVVFNPQGTRLLGVSEHCATVWDVLSGTGLVSIAHQTKLLDVAGFSPNGTRFLTTAEDGTARVWDSRTGHPETTPLAHSGKVTSAQFSPDGQHLLTAAGELSFVIWDLNTGRRIDRCWPHRAPVQSACYTRDGQRVLSSTLHAGAQLWDIKTGHSLSEQFGRDRIATASFGPGESKILLSAYDDTWQCWDGISGQRLSEALWDGTGRRAASLDGRLLATSFAEGRIAVWELPVVSLPVPAWLPELAEGLAGQRFNSQGALEPVRAGELWAVQQKMAAWADGENTREASSGRLMAASPELDTVQSRASQPAGGLEALAAPGRFYTRWAKWFLADASTRTVLPSSPLTLAEHAQKMAEQRANLASCREAALLQPGNAAVLASFALLTTNTLDADWISRRAVELAPESEGVLWAREDILRRSGRFTEALDYLEHNRSLWTNNPWIWANKADVLKESGRLEEALDHYSQSIALARYTSPAATAYDRGLRRALIDATLTKRWRLLRQMNRPAEAQEDFFEAKHIPRRAPRISSSPFNLIDLRSHLNQGLQDFGLTRPLGATNSTAPVHAMSGVEFELCGYIVLDDRATDPAFPAGVENIKVGQRCRALHFLQSCNACPGCTNQFLVASYVVHYAGGAEDRIPIVGARDVRYWFDPNKELGPGTEEAWSGRTDNGDLCRLFKHTWINPHPELEVQSIDFLSAGPYSPHPILLAITVEQ